MEPQPGLSVAELSYIASLVIGAMFLNESVTPLRVAGVLVIVAGVVLVTKS